MEWTQEKEKYGKSLKFLTLSRSQVDLNEAITTIKIIETFLQHAAVLQFLQVYFSSLRTVASPQLFHRHRRGQILSSIL